MLPVTRLIGSIRRGEIRWLNYLLASVLALGSDDGRLQLLASARLGSSSALSSAVQLGDEEGALLACGMLGRGGGGGGSGGGGGGGGGEHGSVLLYSTEAPAPLLSPLAP